MLSLRLAIHSLDALPIRVDKVKVAAICLLLPLLSSGDGFLALWADAPHLDGFRTERLGGGTVSLRGREGHERPAAIDYASLRSR
eukprot:1891222-Rhodomonas_salina.2